MNKELRSAALLFLTAAIWGFAMAAQRDGAQYLDPFTFNAFRYLLGSLAILPMTLLEHRRQEKGKRKLYTKKEIGCGLLVGLVLFIASILQQFGVSDAGAGKAGFLTALYVVLVPVLGVFVKKKTRLTTWLALILALPALYLLCVPENEAFSLAPADSFLLLGAFFWAIHILLTDHFVLSVSPLKLCTMQFILVFALNLICALLFETTTWDHLLRGFWAVAYCGILSTAVGYTFQTIGQKGCRPAYAALILSLESVFCLFAGALLLGERMNGRGYVGCALMLLAVILAQAGTLIKPKKEKIHV